MKKLLSISFLVLSLTLLSHSTSFAQDGTTKLGIGLLYGETAESIGLQANATFRVTPSIAIAPDVSLYFPDENETGLDSFVGLNLNGHYIFAADTEFHIYVLGGLNVAIVESAITGDSESELGINLGAGGEYHLENFSLFTELKYVISDADGVVLGVGARLPLN